MLYQEAMQSSGASNYGCTLDISQNTMRFPAKSQNPKNAKKLFLIIDLQSLQIIKEQENARTEKLDLSRLFDVQDDTDPDPKALTLTFLPHRQPDRVVFLHVSLKDLVVDILKPRAASCPRTICTEKKHLVQYNTVLYRHPLGGLEVVSVILDLKNKDILHRPPGFHWSLIDGNENADSEEEKLAQALRRTYHPIIHFWQLKRILEHPADVGKGGKLVQNGLTIMCEGMQDQVVEFLTSHQRLSFVETLLPYMPLVITGTLDLEVYLHHSNVPHMAPHVEYLHDQHMVPILSEDVHPNIKREVASAEMRRLMIKWTGTSRIKISDTDHQRPSLPKPETLARFHRPPLRPLGRHWHTWTRAECNTHAAACNACFMSELTRRLKTSPHSINAQIKTCSVDIGPYVMSNEAKVKPSLASRLSCGLLSGGGQKGSKLQALAICRALFQELKLGHFTPEMAYNAEISNGVGAAEEASKKTAMKMASGGGLDEFETQLLARCDGWQAVIVSSSKPLLNRTSTSTEPRPMMLVKKVDSLLQLQAHAPKSYRKASQKGNTDDGPLSVLLSPATSPSAEVDTHESALCARLWAATSGMVQADVDSTNPLRSSILNLIAN